MKKTPPSMEWSETLEFGVDEIDATHKTLFRLIHALKNSKQRDASTVFDDLRRYGLHHCQHEEKLIAAHHTDTSFKRVHRDFHVHWVSYLDRVGRMIHEGTTAELNQVLDFLLVWLIWHIMIMDIWIVRKMREPTVVHRPDVLAMQEVGEIYRRLGQKILEWDDVNKHLEDEISRSKVIELDLALSNARLHAMVNFSHSWEYWEEPNGQIIYTSPSCERITGYAADAFIKNSQLIYDIIHPEDRHIMEAHRLDRMVHEDGEEELQFRIVRPDGSVHRVGHSCQVVYGSAGRFLGRRGSIRDRGERYEKEEQQRMAETVFTSVNEAVLVADDEWRVLRVNRSFTRITGFVFDEIQCEAAINLFHDGDAPGKVMQIVKLAESTGFWQGEILCRHKNGHVFDGWASIYCVKNKNGLRANYVLVFSDISERKKNEAKIYRLAHFDMLTGLPNRALLLDRLQQGLLKARREATLLAVMFVDLDKFKLVNDTLGHYIGDLLLKEVANRLDACVRESDTAARIGGDEFIVLLPTVQSIEAAKHVGETILGRIREEYMLEGNRVNIGVSIGIAVFPMHGQTHEELMTNADAAMYQAKHGGGHSVISFDEVTPG